MDLHNFCLYVQWYAYMSRFVFFSFFHERDERTQRRKLIFSRTRATVSSKLMFGSKRQPCSPLPILTCDSFRKTLTPRPAEIMSVDTPTMMLSVLEHLASAEGDLPSESRTHVASAISSLSSAFGLSLEDPKQVSRHPSLEFMWLSTGGK